MKNLTKARVMTLLLIVAVFSSPVPTSAVSYDPGCKKDDYVKLEFSGDVSEFEGSWIKIEVRDIDGDNVSLKVTVGNDTDQETENTWIDVEEMDMPAGMGLFYGLILDASPVIPGGLEAGDAYYEGTDYTINETADIEIGGNTFTANKLVDTSGSSTFTAYWHQERGLLLKSHWEHNGDEGTWELVDTNLPTVGILDRVLDPILGLGTTNVMLIGAGVIILILLILLGRKK